MFLYTQPTVQDYVRSARASLDNRANNRDYVQDISDYLGFALRLIGQQDSTKTTPELPMPGIQPQARIKMGHTVQMGVSR